MEEEVQEAPKRKGEPFGSPSRSKPYTRRNPARVQRNWMGVYNLLGLIYNPGLDENPSIHVALTNRVCERHAV